MPNIVDRKMNPRHLIFCLFLIIEFIFYRYTHHSWLFLIQFATALSIMMFSKKEATLPSKKFLYFLAFSFSITAIQSLLNGSFLLEERWILRYMNLLIFFFGFQFFSKEEEFQSTGWPLTIYVFLVSGLSFFQYLFIFSASSVDSINSFASRFWNISFYAQAMTLFLPFLSFFKNMSESKAFSLLANTTLFLILVTLFGSHSRASLAGAAAFLIIEFWKPRGFERKILTSILFLALGTHSIVWMLKDGVSNDVSRMKNASMSYRASVLEKSVRMALDYPTGVGPSKFTYQLFLYYDKNPTHYFPFERYKTPHNEPLQVLTEDGWAIFAIYSASLIALIFLTSSAIIKNDSSSPFSRFFICLIPEIFLQFPFDMYFPVLLFALSFPSFLGNVNSFNFKWSKSKSITLTLISVGILFTYWIRERKIIPKEYAQIYCAIFHDNFDICRPYFKDYYEENKLEIASEIMRPILKYQPYNFSALAFDYSLGSEPRSQIAACLYFDLFNGEHKIPESPTEGCKLSENLTQKRERFEEYSDRR